MAVKELLRESMIVKLHPIMSVEVCTPLPLVQDSVRALSLSLSLSLTHTQTHTHTHTLSLSHTHTHTHLV